jgi:predicted small lipoprotein YifL
MKKIIAILLILCMIFSLSGCAKNEKNPVEVEPKDTEVLKTQMQELETQMNKELQNTIDTLNAEFKEISKGINNYDDYVKNQERITEFYKEIDDKTKIAFISLEVYTLKYVETIIEFWTTSHIEPEMLDELYDIFCVSACNKLYDEIYVGLLEEIFDAFQSGALDEYTIPYKETRKVRSDDYTNWGVAHSNINNYYENSRKFIYNFYYDLSDAQSTGDLQKVVDVLYDYKTQF